MLLLQNVLASEFQALYQALAAGREPELPTLRVQYTDYAAWQRMRLDAGQLAGGVAYWKVCLACDLTVTYVCFCGVTTFAA